MLDSLVESLNPPNVKERPCLSCESTFTSEWAGERVCKKCKQSSAWRSGVAHKPAR